MTHIDGPFFWIPAATLIRCIHIIEENRDVETVFPFRTHHAARAIQFGHMECFDYNRELHYIRIAASPVGDHTHRAALKLHFRITPFGLLPHIIIWRAISFWRRSSPRLDGFPRGCLS